MKSQTRFFYLVMAIATIFCHSTINATQLKTEKDRLSYSIGVNLGENFKKQAIDLNPQVLAKGIEDALTGKPLLMSEEETLAVMQAFQDQVIQQRAQTVEREGAKNLQAGQAFLSKNKQKKGVVTLPSGLQYQVLKKGSGPKPGPNSRVTTHYRGTLLDGTEFDSSFIKNKPATFPINAVIPGWTEALQLMSVGSKWKLFIPAELAYGATGVGDVIGPHATLVFEVELLKVE